MNMITANFFMSDACVGIEIETYVFQVCDGVEEGSVCLYTNYNLQASTSACTSKSSVCISCLDMRPYTDHHVKAVSLATAEICVESRRGGGAHRKDGREQSIVIVEHGHRHTWLPRENRLHSLVMGRWSMSYFS